MTLSFGDCRRRPKRGCGKGIFGSTVQGEKASAVEASQRSSADLGAVFRLESNWKAVITKTRVDNDGRRFEKLIVAIPDRIQVK